MNRLAVLSLIALAGCTAGRKSTWETSPADAVAPEGGEAPEVLEGKGDQAFERRDDRASLEAALAAWEQAAKLRPDDPKLWGKLSRGYFFLADAHLRQQGDQSAEYLSTYEKGVAAGEKGMAAASPKFKEHVVKGGSVEDGAQLLEAAAVPSMYWYASCLGKWSRAKGFAVTLGNKDRIKAVMTRVMELEPRYFHGAPDRYFGAFYGVAPGFAGGDLDKSKQHFEKSLELAPYYAGTKVLMAEIWAVKKNDRATFDRLLDEVVKQNEADTPDLAAEIKNEKQKAAELQAKAKELF